MFIPGDDLSALLFFTSRAVETELVVAQLDLFAVDDPGLVGANVAWPHDQLCAVFEPALDVDDEFGQAGLDGAIGLHEENLRRRAVEWPEV